MQAKSLGITAHQKAEILDTEFPDTAPDGHILVDVDYSLISPGTELDDFNHDKFKSPSNPGYTAVGKVLSGKSFEGEDLTGETVFLFPDRYDSTGHHAAIKVFDNKGLAVVLPEGLAPDKACFARLTNVAMTPFCNAARKTGGVLAVLGLGMVGNLTGQVGRIKGFEVIGLETNAARSERAKACGFDHIIDPSKGNAVEAVRDLTGGRGVDLVVNATGLTAVFPDSVQMAADGGEISTLGGFRGEFQTNLQPIIGTIHSRHLVLRGGWELQLPMRSAPAQECASTEMNLRDAMRWLKDGAIDLEHLWTHTVRPEEMQQAYEALNAKDEAYLGVIVDWTSHKKK